MTYELLTMPQRSAEWFAARAGLLTGSAAKDMLATIKSGEAAARRDLRTKLVCERLTGTPQEDGFINDAMQRGIDLEPKARLAYEALTGHVVTETGFARSLEHLVGCSLDGHIGSPSSELVSIKVPKSATHLRYWRDGNLPSDYVPQMLHECWVTGARRYHFVSYDDRFPAHLQVFVTIVEPTEAQIAEYAGKALAFLDEVATEEAAWRGWSAAKER